MSHLSRTCHMPFSSWRGIVGMINPTMRPGVTEEVIRLLPHGIGLIPLFLDFRRGSTDEFKAAMPAYERNVALLAEHACDLIHPVGAPPFMVLGRKAESRLVATWEKKYKTTIFTVAQNHVAALKTLKARTIVGATYFPGKINDVFAKYFSDAGFTVRGMEGDRGAVRQSAGTVGRTGLCAHQTQPRRALPGHRRANLRA